MSWSKPSCAGDTVGRLVLGRLARIVPEAVAAGAGAATGLAAATGP
jgi:hypothetical protein